MLNRIKTLIQKNQLTNEIVTNYDFRTIVFSLGSFLIGLAYAAFNLSVAFLYHNAWFGALAGYYVMLDIIRGGVLRNRHRLQKNKTCADKRTADERKQYLICGILLIASTALLSAMVIHITRQDKTFHYPPWLIYMTAGYTFYRIGTAVYNFMKSRRKHDFTVRALRCINLATALASFLSLQSAALTAFSTVINQTAANALTGGIVCGLIAALGIFMVAGAVGSPKFRAKKQI